MILGLSKTLFTRFFLPFASKSRGSGIVADGARRLAKGLEAAMRPEVEAEYASRLLDASPRRQFWLHLEMEREIDRRVAAATPRGALY